MFYDLNVRYNPDDSDEVRHQMVRMAIKLGYDGIAWNYTVDGRVMPQHICAIEPAPLPAETVPTVRSKGTIRLEASAKYFRQYTRITVVLNDTGDVYAMNEATDILKSYDLVAAQPTSSETFQLLAESHRFLDIVSLDCSQRLPYRLKKSLTTSYTTTGCVFELSFSHALASRTSRREFFTAFAALNRLLKGRHTILTSAATRPLSLRSAYDVTSFGVLCGLCNARAKDTVSTTPELILLNAHERHSFRGIATLIVHDVQGQEDQEQGNDDVVSMDVDQTAGAGLGAGVTTTTTTSSTQ